jgi:hypothetical protein
MVFDKCSYFSIRRIEIIYHLSKTMENKKVTQRSVSKRHPKRHPSVTASPFFKNILSISDFILLVCMKNVEKKGDAVTLR